MIFESIQITLTTIIVLIKLIILGRLFSIFLQNYFKFKARFTIGLLTFTSLIIIENVFTLATILLSIDLLMPLIENIIELMGIIVLYILIAKN
ncbi:hypothetical protein MBCUT_02680 [Methanobrevibacter cuticularis]|uniref:Uncharacterized protein n=1 Tax=Methanobrevibacter cuticularis TaxID=47311 RepID=A0A166F7M8_9EURY|nr:hypothetical protein MBCUT_02680 [Methanobrevibacter cuticularis]